MTRNLGDFLSAQRQFRRYSQADVEQGANAIILAADGKMARADALMFARHTFEAIGLERNPNPAAACGAYREVM
jgi:hypothetical protein